MIEEGFFLCSIIRDVSITSLRVIRIARVFYEMGAAGLVPSVLLGNGV